MLGVGRETAKRAEKRTRSWIVAFAVLPPYEIVMVSPQCDPPSHCYPVRPSQIFSRIGGRQGRTGVFIATIYSDNTMCVSDPLDMHRSPHSQSRCPC
jgi:hypothetical protein